MTNRTKISKRKVKVAKNEFVFKKIAKSTMEKNLAQISAALKQITGEKKLR